MNAGDGEGTAAPPVEGANAHPRAEQIAREFHEAYEDLAPEFGYRTRKESAVPWSEVPSGNKGLMVATVTRLLNRGAIR